MKIKSSLLFCIPLTFHYFAAARRRQEAPQQCKIKKKDYFYFALHSAFTIFAEILCLNKMNYVMEKTLVLLKPSCVQRQLIGEIVNRFERRGLRVAGMKMMQLSDEILREHYAHLVDRPFFPAFAASMQASPVVALALEGVDAVQVVRTMTGSTNGREAAPGTIRGDYSMSNQQNIVHASDSTSNAEIELKRFFRDEEIFDYTSGAFGFIYGDGEAK